MAERGFITPPPGLLPEPSTPAEQPGDTVRPAPIPTFFPAPPGATPPAASEPVAVPPAPEQGADAVNTPSSAAAAAPERPDVAAPEVTGAPPARSGWTLDLEGAPVGPVPAVLVLGRAPSIVEEGAVLLAVSGGGTVSKTHAVVRLDGDALTVEDLGSTNGTAVTMAGERTVLRPRVPFPVTEDAQLHLAEARLLLRRA